jgi:hypothetical protein
MKGFAWLVCFATAFFVSPLSVGAAPAPGSGTFTVTSYIEGNTIIGGGGSTTYFNQERNWIGALSGYSAATGSCKTQSNGRKSCRQDGSMLATFEGHTGLIHFSESIDVDLATGSYSGRISFGDGSGDLARLHGHGTIQGTSSGGSYSVQVGV